MAFLEFLLNAQSVQQDLSTLAVWNSDLLTQPCVTGSCSAHSSPRVLFFFFPESYILPCLMESCSAHGNFRTQPKSNFLSFFSALLPFLWYLDTQIPEEGKFNSPEL